MERNELVEAIVKRANVSKDQADMAVNETIVSMVSPHVFKKPGDLVGFLDNHCTNNCKAPDVGNMPETRRQ